MSCVDLRYSIVPTPNGSVLLVFKCTARCVGVVWKSTDISSDDSMLGVQASCERQVNSPTQTNPKNPSQNVSFRSGLELLFGLV